VRAALLAAVLAGLLWSGWAPHDRFTWWLEVAPVLLVLPLLLATGRRFPLTPLLYVLIALHAWVLMVGGHWTYAEVPAGFWVKDALGLARNPYDRLGHLMQGFVPAIVARELLWRTSPLRGSRWLPPLVVCVCLAVSACYELVEWRVAVGTGSAAEAFLGTQGDVWDTQWDMAMAGVGAVLALLLLSRMHERQLRKLAAAGP
jgi:putative membrane protein